MPRLRRSGSGCGDALALGRAWIVQIHSYGAAPEGTPGLDLASVAITYRSGVAEHPARWIRRTKEHARITGPQFSCGTARVRHSV